MSSQQSQPSQESRTSARRRQRSTRLVVAVGLLVVAALLVIGSIASGSPAVVTVAAVVALLAGASATRITHSELMEARRHAARDRATQARDYLVLTERRTAENAAFATDMRRKIADREHAMDVLERALSSAQRNVAEQTLKRGQEAHRADRAESGCDAAETRAAEAIVLVAELESELDVVRAELDAIRADNARRGHRSA